MAGEGNSLRQELPGMGVAGVTGSKPLTCRGRQRLWERHLFVFLATRIITRCDQTRRANGVQMEHWLGAGSSWRL